MKFEDDPPSGAAVAQCLAAVKRDGGSILVVGAARGAQSAICEEFQDGETAEVLVSTEGTVRRTAGGDEPTSVIERPVPTRSAASSSNAEPTDVRSVGADLEAELRSLADVESVRVCFDSLRPFVDGPDRTALVSVMESVRDAARETGAVVHFHLPAMPEAVPAELFDAVDAVARVLQQGETTYQQWQLPDDGTTTGWVTR